MTTIQITRKAKCSDCKFCRSFMDGNRKKHTCTNQESNRHTEIILLKDLVCSNWKL